jgi:hypothetical protein
MRMFHGKLSEYGNDFEKNFCSFFGISDADLRTMYLEEQAGQFIKKHMIDTVMFFLELVEFLKKNGEETAAKKMLDNFTLIFKNKFPSFNPSKPD